MDVQGESGAQEEIVYKFPIKKRRFIKYLFIVQFMQEMHCHTFTDPIGSLKYIFYKNWKVMHIT